jgi:hypothetical protein
VAQDVVNVAPVPDITTALGALHVYGATPPDAVNVWLTYLVRFAELGETTSVCGLLT